MQSINVMSTSISHFQLHSILNIISIDPSQPKQKTNFQPTSGYGSQAHITLGRAKDIPPVQAATDLIEIIKLEKRWKNEKESNYYSWKFTKAYDYGEGKIALYFNNPIRFESVFGGHY